MKRFWDIFKNVDIYAQNESFWPTAESPNFFSKIQLRQFLSFISVYIHAKIQKNSTNGSQDIF